ncbi:distal tail protein Dit [Bacillus sp. JJ1566]|uniref:distal tail protein Dit n=1 Tax=Bacillus sp. JJ1566 TaxID=3122961 RepID=UPI002FFD9324
MYQNSLSYRGIKKDYILVTSRKRSYWAPVRRNLIFIPGRAGALLNDSTTEVRIEEVTIEISADDPSNYLNLTEDLAAWLITENVEELIFDDEQNRTYYAVVDGGINNLQEIVTRGYGTLRFICPDSYKYGLEKKVTLIGESVNVEGTAETEPIITCKVKQDTTFVAVSNGTDLNIVGNYGLVDEIPFEPETRILWDQMGAMTGWTSSSSVEQGTASGTMKTNGYEFYTDDYGTGDGWHGPPVKKSIGATLQDFKIDVLLSQIGISMGEGGSDYSGGLGSVEIALLDANNQFVAKLLLTKRYAHSKAIYATLRAGRYDNGHDIINERGDAEWVWANFDGILRLSRKRARWEAYVAKIDENGKHHSTRLRSWDDTEGIATAPVTQVQVQLWAHGSTRITSQSVKDIKIFRLNQQAQGIPFIARAGDIVEFNNQNDIIRRNGEDITKEKMFIGNYFALKPGQNVLAAEPADAIEEITVKYHPKFL